MLNSLNNYYEMCEENLMGNEELIPNISNIENFDQNYLINLLWKKPNGELKEVCDEVRSNLKFEVEEGQEKKIFDYLEQRVNFINSKIVPE